MRMLVVHTGGVGDFLLFCPALKQLALQSHVELAGNEERLALAVEAGLASAAHDIDALDFGSVFGTPSNKLRRALAQLDRVVVWMGDASGELTAKLRACGVHNPECYPGLPPADWGAHASDWYASCLGFPAPPPLHLPVRPVTHFIDVVIHPGSGGHKKNWPLDRFRQLATKLEASGRRVTWSLGPAERENDAFSALAPVLEPMTLTRLARYLATARLYIGNDSGITHLAAAVGCCTVAIFGPTNPHVWAPRGEQVRVLHCPNWPPVDEVLAAIQDV